MNCAVIDVGSNSVRMMILVDGKPIYEETKTVRLGVGLVLDGQICENEFAMAVDVIDMFCKRARNSHAFNICIFGTATLRAAKNSRLFCLAVYARTGERINVLSGDDEAKIGYIGGICGDLSNSVVIDIGGGSVEIAVGDNGCVSTSQSIDIGAVRIFAKCGDNKEAIENYIELMIGNVKPLMNITASYAIGGTSTSVAMLLAGGNKYDKTVTHGFVIETEKLEELTHNLFRMGQVGRSKLLSIKTERREIIAGGAMLLLRVLQKLEIDKIKASESDNLIGYYLTFIEKK